MIEYAIEHSPSCRIVSASGGALDAQLLLLNAHMAKQFWLWHSSEKGIYIYLYPLTNPTTGGVTASFASLGDIIIAEPDA